MEAFAYLHSPLTQSVFKAVREKEIGEPVFMESSFLLKEWEADNIRMRKETFGGCTYDLGCYNISMILGAFDEMPEKMKAMANFMTNGVDDYSTALFYFPSGKRASASQGMCCGQRGDRCYIYGTKGTIEVPNPFNADGELAYYIHKDGKTTEYKMSVKSNYQLEIEQFGRCILEGEKPLVSSEFTIKTAEVLHQVLEEIGY